MSFIIKLIVAGSLCILALTGDCQQKQVVSLQACEDSALNFSYAIRTGKVKVSMAESSIKAAQSLSHPQVSGFGGGFHAFRELLPAMPPVLSAPLQTFYVGGITANQVLYAGGRLRAGAEMARLALELQNMMSRLTEDSILLVTAQKYWALVALQEREKVLEKNRLALEALMQQQKDLLNAGIVARNDELQIAVELSKLMLAREQLANARRVSLLEFCWFIGIAFNERIYMADTVKADAIAPAQLPDTSLTGNVHFELVNRSAEMVELEKRMLVGTMMPSVSVGVTASQLGLVGKGGGSNFIPGSMLTVQVPISDWWGKGRQELRRSASAKVLADIQVAQAERMLKLAVMQSWYACKDAMAEVHFSRLVSAASASNLNVLMDSYNSGLVNISDVLSAQASCQEAESTAISAAAALESRKAAYKYLTGGK